MLMTGSRKMENNLEVAGVEAAEKVLFATHYLSGPARAWWTSARAMNAGQMMTWEDFKLKFSKYHVPQGLIKKMRDEFRELKKGRMSVVEYRDRFLTRQGTPDETDTNEKRKERFLNGLHDEMQTVLVNIPFADLEALVDSAIQMEGKLHQANENRKRRMMNQSGPHHNQKYRNNSSGGFTPRYHKSPTETLGSLLKRKIKTVTDDAAVSMLMPPPSSKYLYKYEATRQLDGDLLINMAETAAPLLKWIKNEADEAAVRTMVPAPSSENIYKHEATGQLGGDLLMNLDETSVSLLKWIKNDPDEAAVKTMVPPLSSENLYKHKATGQLGGILFMKQTETAKPSLVKRIATAADEASAEAATKLLSAPPSGYVYKRKSKQQPGGNHPMV
ncbi:hypothetical protein QYE76_008662 [Lolium multiflorum]|uniref:Retrotransposon gag domain-containing protein n=1 Tax=Lolium multiflorum TaxID=4521 RepID=A0AAD8TTR7_LOLMU|nr:hypothetical protein QYE76_008662 [Lolium multiflorum]